MRPLVILALAIGLATAASAGLRDFVFSSIDGGKLQMSEWEGQPVLVVNTASQCGFTPQYAGLQALQDQYGAQGLVVLAVPSDDFNQELETAEEVREFCELTFGLDLPMADITPVKGTDAHPFYKAVREATGFVPAWNFNKVLIAPDGAVVATWGARTEPMSREIRQAVEALLGGS